MLTISLGPLALVAMLLAAYSTASLAQGTSIAAEQAARKNVLNPGLVMEITTSGNAETVLNYKYFKMDRPTVLNLAESGKIFNSARNLGFHLVIFTDSRLSWIYDVAANRFK